MKILNKQNRKWWGNRKDTTWAFKKGEDWWLLKPEKKNLKTPPQKKKSAKKEQGVFRQMCEVAFFSVMTAIGLFVISALVILIKDAV